MCTKDPKELRIGLARFYHTHCSVLPYWLRTFDSFAPEEAAKVPDYVFCGILSPLFANVSLNELDRMMEEKIV